MVKSKAIIKDPIGLHLRPASNLSQLAVKYESSILLRIGQTTVNAKSVLGILGAAIKCGDEIEFECDGKDEKEAIKALESFASKNL